MLDLLRTHRLLRMVLALVVLGGVAVPLAAPVCAAAMHHQEGTEHEAMHEHEPVKRVCCCGHERSQDHQAEVPCPEDEAPERHRAATPCCTVTSAFATDEVQVTAVLVAAPQVPMLTLSRLAVAPLPVAPNVPPRRSPDNATDPPELGGVDRHVFIATFLI